MQSGGPFFKAEVLDLFLADDPILGAAAGEEARRAHRVAARDPLDGNIPFRSGYPPQVFDAHSQSRARYGLEEIVDGVQFEGLDGVFVEGGAEDDLRPPRTKRPDDLKAVRTGHLDVQENSVRP